MITVCEVEGVPCLALPEIKEESVPELTVELVKFISIYHPKEIVAFGGSETPGDIGETTETQIMRLFVKAFSHTELLQVESVSSHSLPSLSVQPSTSPSGTKSPGSSRRLWRRKSPRGAKIGGKSSNYSREENSRSTTSTPDIEKLEASLQSFQVKAEADNAQRDGVNIEAGDRIPGKEQNLVKCVEDGPTLYSALPAPPQRKIPSSKT